MALGKLTRVRLLLEAGHLTRLTSQQLQTDYAHYLVYPPRSAGHMGLQAFAQWLHAQARDYAAAMQAPALPQAPSRRRTIRSH